MILIKLLPFLFLNYSNAIDSASSNYRNFFIQKIDSLQNTKMLENGILGISIKNCKTGEKIIGYNETKSLRPASTLKLVTTATALGLLGEKFRYQTALEYTGIIKNDTLFGNIIIKGSGDPTLGSWRFDETLDYSRLMLNWATKIKELNIKVITGNVIANANIFSDNEVPETWQWGDIGNYYGAASFGLNINENLFKAHFKTNKYTGDNSNLFKIEPNLTDFQIINSVIGDKETNSDDVYLYSSPLGNSILAKGKLPLNREDFIVKGSLSDPPNLAAKLLKNALNKIEVAVLNRDKNNQNIDSTIIIIIKSPSLFEICLNTNYESINLYAESLLKTIAQSAGKTQNTKNGIETLENYWKSKSLNLKGLYMKDGSGLSTSNAITPANMTDILTAASNETFFDAFHQGIAVLGKDGSVKNIAKNKPWANNFRIKTGTIEKVKSFAGYFNNKKGELMAFSIMANQFEGSESGMSRELVTLFEDMWGLE